MWTCPHFRPPKQFRVSIHDRSNEFRLEIEGPLGAAESREVESCWQTAASTIGGRRFVVDLAGVRTIDAAAAALLSRMGRAGAQIRGGDAIPTYESQHPAVADSRFLAPSRLASLAFCLALRLRAWRANRAALS